MSKHIYRGVEITTERNGFSGKWGARFTYPGEEEEVSTSFWADEERLVLAHMKGRIDAWIEIKETGEFALNLPE